jgi:hypothetical protein
VTRVGDAAPESLSINNHGEYVWATTASPNVVASSVRGSLATGGWAALASINDNGDTVWQGTPNTSGPWQIYENGASVTPDATGFGAYSPVLLQSGEVLWRVQRGGIWSSTRGHVVTDATAIQYAANDRGEVVYSVDSNSQIVSNQRGIIASGTRALGAPAINESGEVIWLEGDTVVHSSTRGVLAVEEFVTGGPVINRAGDVAWIAAVGGTCADGGSCTGSKQEVTLYRCGTITRVEPSAFDNVFPVAMNDQGTIIFGGLRSASAPPTDAGAVGVYRATCTSAP